jgi:adenylate kinase
VTYCTFLIFLPATYSALIDDSITNAIMKKRLAKSDCKKGYILDGYPRTTAQAKFLESFSKTDVVLNIVLNEEMIIKKIAGRRVCTKCRKIYNIADVKHGALHLAPILPKKDGVCDRCNSKLVQRSDDNKKTMRGRMKIYNKESKPVLGFYRKKKIVANIKVNGLPEVMMPIILKAVSS